MNVGGVRIKSIIKGRGKAVYIFGWSGLEDELKLWCGCMVTFITDDEAVITNELLGYWFSGLGVLAGQRLE